MTTILGVEFLRQPSADLIEQEPHQRLGARNVRGRHHEIERRGLLG